MFVRLSHVKKKFNFHLLAHITCRLFVALLLLLFILLLLLSWGFMVRRGILDHVEHNQLPSQLCMRADCNRNLVHIFLLATVNNRLEIAEETKRP